MDDKRTISISFSKGSVLTDVSAQCAALARTIELSSTAGKTEEAESVRILAGYINSPSDNVIRPVVARALTEGFDQIKSVCQRYLMLGRMEDDDRLESIIEGEVVTPYRGQPASGGILGSFTPEAGVKYKVVLEGLSESWEAAIILEYNLRTISLSGGSPVCEIEGVYNGGSAVFSYDGQVAIPNEITITADSTAYAELVLDLAMPDNFNIGVTSTIKSSAHKILVDYVLSQVLRFQRPDESAGLLKSVEWTKEQLLKALTARNTFTRSHQDWM